MDMTLNECVCSKEFISSPINSWISRLSDSYTVIERVTQLESPKIKTLLKALIMKVSSSLTHRVILIN